MESRMTEFANQKAVLNDSTHQTRQPDPQRTEFARLNKLKFTRHNVPNSKQQRAENTTRPAGVKQEQARGTFEGSALDDTTVTTTSREQVEDSQLGLQAQPVEHNLRNEQTRQQDLQRQEDYEDDDESDDEVYSADDNEHTDQTSNALNIVNNFIRQGMVTARVHSPSVLGRFQKGDSYPSTTEDGYSMRGYDQQDPFKDARPVTASNIRGQSGAHMNVGQQSSYQKTNVRHSATVHAKDDLLHGHRTPAHHVTVAAAHDIRDMPMRAHQNQHLAPQTTHQAVYVPAQARAVDARPTTATGIKHSTRSMPFASARPKPVITAINEPIASQVNVPSLSLHEAILTKEDDETVLKSSFEALHAKEVDENRKKNTSVLGQADAQKPLEGQLQVVLQMNAEQKHDFMTSLSIAQWEEAGDWLMDRFGEVMAKMKDARKQRRRLTVEMGQEIYNRHKLVEGKKRGIEEALTEMGKTGNDVLRSGTPKRSRR